MDKPNLISIREFARRVNSSESGIRKFIKNGKISKGIDTDGKIIYDVALKEYKVWAGHKLPDKIIIPKVESKKEVKASKPKSVIVEVEEQAEVIEEVSIEEEVSIKIKNSTKYEEAKRLEAVIKTRTAQLEYEQLKGSLVSSKEVYKELYAVGQSVRSSLQGIPDKYIDNILACETRIEAHELLTKAITQALEELSNAVKEVEI